MTQQQEWPPEAQRWFDGQEVLIDKPLGWTSFDVVNKVRIGLRNAFGIRKIKVGHAGTLDPLATGLLIVCTGRFTKKLEGYQELGKEYIAQVRLGATTPSFDLETEEDQTFPFHHISENQIREVLESFKGPQLQTPPLYSAKKIAGKRAYDYARGGETTTVRSQAIEIYDIELLSYDLPDIRIRVSCSKGTYIRALARDLGHRLDSGGHLTGLIRTAIGHYLLKDAWKIDDLEKIFSQT